jgi:hypothetical protein
MTPQTTPDQTTTQTRAKVLDLSLTQLLGGSAAAATAAALGSRLGVVGTIAGAAVLSLISAVAASLYTASMTRARDAVVLLRTRRGGLEEVPLSMVEPPESAAAPSAPAPRAWWPRLDRATTRRVLVTTGALFAISAAFLTGLQLATGAQVTGTSIGSRVSAASGAGAPADRSGGTGTVPSSGASGTPTAPGVSTAGGSTAPAGAAQTGQNTGSPAATTGASQATAPAATQTAPAATSATPAGGIPTASFSPTSP